MYVNNKEDIVVVFFRYQVETNSATTVVPGDKKPQPRTDTAAVPHLPYIIQKIRRKAGQAPTGKYNSWDPQRNELARSSTQERPLGKKA